MNNIEARIRDDLKALQPYQVDKSSSEQIRLDKNELPWDLLAEGLEANRYPVLCKTVIQRLAQYYNVDANEIELTRGSDDGIDLLTRLFCQPFQDEIITCPPTFSMYDLCAKYQGIKVKEVPLCDDYNNALDTLAILKSVNKTVKLIYVCSPNNPTGTLVPIADIFTLCNTISSAMIVVDEAYIEFSDATSMSAYIKQFPNLVVLRTFSKAFGLAAFRCGVVMANEKIISYLKALMPPFAIPQPSMEAVLKALTVPYLAKIKTCISIIKIQRQQLSAFLSSLPFVKKIWNSHANFILIEVDNAQAIFAICKQNNIFLKSFNVNSKLKNCLRISIGTDEQNQQLMRVLKRVAI